MSEESEGLIEHEHGGYGFFPGGDPRRFSPDPECSDDEEREAHRAACAAWDEAERAGLPPPESRGSCVHMPGVILTLSGFGLGVYSYPCSDPACEDSHPPDPDEPDLDEEVDAATREAALREALAGDDEDVSDQDDEPEVRRG